MDLHFTALNPLSSDEVASENKGKKLLNLIKSFERCCKDGEESAEIETSIFDSLSEMIKIYNHYGLFTDKESRKKYSSSVNTSNNTKKRKRGGGSGSSGKIASILNLDGSNSSEEAYALSNLCRILIPSAEKGLIFTPSLVATAANAMGAICQYCMNHLNGKTSVMAEQEIIGSIASQLISGLSKTMKILLDKKETLVDIESALIECCNCAKNVIILSNLKLSRNCTIMGSIENVAKEILLHDDQGSIEISGVIEAAAGLIASIPIVGNSNGVAPVQIWSEKVLETTMELSSILRAFFPLVKKFKKGRGSSSIKGNLDWIDEIRTTVISQADRLLVFFTRIKGLVVVLAKLLKMDGYHHTNAGNGVAIPITALLDTSEQMLLFASIAETRYLATKSRLRDVSVEGGLLSPNAAVIIANSVKFLGFTLFESISSSLTTTSLPYGKQLMQIVLNCLQSSSTLALKRVIEPSSSSDKNSSKKWLHSSIQLRTKAVHAFITVIQRLGSNVAVAQTDVVSKAIAFIAGFLLEQISEGSDCENDSESDHWGCEDELAALVLACCDGLSACLSIFGGFMTIQDRELIESMALTCLQNLGIAQTPRRFCNFTLVKASILRFGVNCVSNPWPDGAASSLVPALRRTAFLLRFDRDNLVSTEAYSAMSICNMAVTPRAPPLVIITRGNTAEDNMTNVSSFFSREALQNGMDEAKDDILRSRIVEKEAIEKKRKVKEAKKDKAQKEKMIVIDNAPDDKGTQREEARKSDEVEKSSPSIYKGENENEAQAPVVMEKQQEIARDRPGDNEADNKMSAGSRIYESIQHDKDTEALEGKDDENDDGSSDGSDDDFPPIIDCGPDDEDI